MPGPATSRAVAEEIARSYEKFERHELINVLAYLTKVYVVDGTMPFSLPGEGGKIAAGGEEAEKELDFPKLIDQLKKRLPKLKELAYFHVEGGKVVLRVQNQKIIFGERVTTEFVRASEAPAPAPAKTSPSAAVGAAASAGKKVAPKKEEGPVLTEAEQEALHDIATRFSKLELD